MVGMLYHGIFGIHLGVTPPNDRFSPKLVFPKGNAGQRDFLPYRFAQAAVVVAVEVQHFSPSLIVGADQVLVAVQAEGFGEFVETSEVALEFFTNQVVSAVMGNVPAKGSCGGRLRLQG